MFTSKNIITVPRQRMTPQNLCSFIKKHTDDGKCYVLKPSSEYDGETLSVEEAIDLFFGLGPFLLYFPEKNILYFEEEENHGAQGRYIMF